MERLTERAIGSFGTSCIQLKACGYELCGETCDKQDGKDGCKNCPIEKALEKLAEYEDLEEQGKLLKLPCAVGDTAYTVYDISGEGFCIVEERMDIPLMTAHVLNEDFGKTVFLTREEAETALSELQR